MCTYNLYVHLCKNVYIGEGTMVVIPVLYLVKVVESFERIQAMTDVVWSVFGHKTKDDGIYSRPTRTWSLFTLASHT